MRSSGSNYPEYEALIGGNETDLVLNIIVNCQKGASVRKLYKFTNKIKEYWETWDNDDRSHTVHWGELGTTGQSREVKGLLLKKPEKITQEEVDEMVSNGFRPLDLEHTLLIEYAVEGIGTKEDVEKRHRLEDRMNETLGWTGLGHCDGGSIGNGTMKVCNFVVDFEVARCVIENDLKETEFANYTRIYDEETEQTVNKRAYYASAI